MILDVRNIQTFYGESQALQGVTLQLDEGETVCSSSLSKFRWLDQKMDSGLRGLRRTYAYR